MPVEDHLNHTPNAEGIAKIEQVRSWIIKLEGVMDAMVPLSRELSIAKTKLEEVRMWAIKGIVMEHPCSPLSPETLNDTNPAFSEQRQAEGLHPAPEPEAIPTLEELVGSDIELPTLEELTESGEPYDPTMVV